MTKIINLYGGPGSGKSTTAAGLFYKMKLKHMSVELISEYAKKLLYSNRLDNMLDQQEYIFAKQNAMLHDLRGKVDYVITDSPLLLSTIYVSKEWPCSETFKKLVVEVYNTYDNINIVLNRPAEFQQYGRRHTKGESEILDTSVKDMVRSCILDYRIIDCDDHVVDSILESDVMLPEYKCS